jgi:putative colanic acid biosynthesis UDP-glucose lipid carrier transferase
MRGGSADQFWNPMLPSEPAPYRESLTVPPPSSGPRAYRLTALRPSSMPPPPEGEYVSALADTLLAAAHADGNACARELRAIRRLMARLLSVTELPEWLDHRIDHFDPSQFDLTQAAEVLHGLPPPERRHVIELVRQVCDADNAFDLEEERYLVALVLSLSLSREDVADLVVHAAEGIDGAGKRLFDVVFAALVLSFGWPLFALLAAGVKLSSPGPVIFRQRRYGRGGAEIEVWKYRTMHVTEDGPEVKQATRGDGRITRFGKWLRKTSLDELPQFVNVLLGDMSVVGPRPHAVAHNQHYRTQILEYMLRHKVKPGITGWAQVNGWRGETDTLDKMIQRVAHDLEYIRRYSLAFDLKIVLMTFFGRANRNAY